MWFKIENNNNYYRRSIKQGVYFWSKVNIM
jgi:hypothetical protein